MKTITFNNGIEDITLNVQNAASFVYNAVKTTLRIIVSEADHTWDEISELSKNTGDIVYKEDDKVMFVYSGYDYPENGLTGSISDGVWTIDIVQKNDLATQINYLQDAVCEIMEIINSTMVEKGV